MSETGGPPEPASPTPEAPARVMTERVTPLATMDALREDVHTLGDLVGQVVREQAGDRIFGLVEEVRLAAIAAREGDTPDDARERALLEWAERQSTADLTLIVRAFTVYFHLINVAEQHHRVRRLHEREQTGHPLPESLAAAVQALHAEGITEARLAALLPALRVHPVFTAHPSEVRRATLLQHLEHCAALLAEHDIFKANPPRRRAIQDALRSAITLVWQTAETRTQRPSVLDEVHSVVRVLSATVYDVAPAAQRALETAVFGEPSAASPPPDTAPFLRLGSWVGGDRDGNPFVTPEVTIAAARLARAAVLRRYLDDVQALGRTLSVSLRLVGASPELLASIEHDRAALGVQAVPQWADEPYRRKCGLIAERLRRTMEDEPGGYLYPDALAADLLLIRDSLVANAGGRIAGDALWDLELRVRTFGFVLCELEIRQHSARFQAAAGELLRLHSDVPYADLDESARAAMLERQLAAPPLALPLAALSAETRQTLATFRAIATIQDRHGEAACRTVIISMCRAPSDVLAVLFLAREAALVTMDASDPAALACQSRIDIVPLFEEAAELRASPRVLETLLASPAYRAALLARGWRQQIMIGYSDSNKDAGYLAATWATHGAQESLARVAQTHGLGLELFHGRGGAVGRGGGPMSRAILARPLDARLPTLKVTEQGEVIFARYSHPAIAERHFEQILQALLRSVLEPPESDPPEEWLAAMDRLAARSREVYQRHIKHAPDFLRFFRAATPFPELSTLNLASRPVSRSAGATLTLDALRAIPWSFSWTQIRANVPGWFGLGSALEEEIAAGGLERLRAMYAGWRFFATAMDNAQRSLGIADMPTVRRYASLAPGGDAQLDLLRAEYARSVRTVLQVTQQQALLERSSVLARSIRLRNPYVDALHVAQIALLRRYRTAASDTADASDSTQAERSALLLDAIHHSINGIAAGLQETG